MSTKPITLIADPEVLAVPIKECNDPFIDIRDQTVIAYEDSPEIPNNTDYTKMLQPSLATQASHGMIYKIVANITPFDKLESDHIKSTLAWIESGVPIFRIQKPDVPNKHMVSYFVLFDEEAKKVLLVDHKKALAWLPTGGHIEVDEHPKDAAIRECYEELGINAEFWRDEPLFLTITETTGLTAGHTDVSLWYVIKGSHLDKYRFDRDEFNDINWFTFDEIPYDNSDPHMQRFIMKLKAA